MFVCNNPQYVEGGTVCLAFVDNINDRTKDPDETKPFLLKNYESNTTSVEKCAMLCTARGKEVGTPGCCEYRLDTQECLWANARNLQNKKHENKKDNRATLCLEGNKYVSVIMCQTCLCFNTN